MGVEELGIRGKTEDGMSESRGLTHRWFYSILLGPQIPERHQVKGKGRLKVDGKMRKQSSETVTFTDLPELTE